MAQTENVRVQGQAEDAQKREGRRRGDGMIRKPTKKELSTDETISSLLSEIKGDLVWWRLPE